MKSRSGFSLLEVMVVIFIVGIALLSLMASQIFAAEAASLYQKRHTASLIAASLLEEAERELWSYFGNSVAKSRQEVPEIPGYEFEVTERVEGPNLKAVEAVVFWADGGRGHQFRMTTKLVAE